MSPDGTTGSANGKVILLGEHAVVYGGSAIAAGIDRGARATLRVLPRGDCSQLSLGDRTLVADPTGDDLARAFAALLARFEAPPVMVVAESDLPAGGGLGSSAALGVAIARAVEGLDATSNGPPLDRVLARARAWEEIFHGAPSGIDTAAAAHGGCFRFSRADGVRPLALARDLWLCIGDSGRGSSTRAMVEGVARTAERKPELFRTTMEGIERLVANAALALEAGDLGAVGSLMNLNQMLLAGLMLSTETIETLCAAARGAGALGAKLTGAGGGGSVVALTPSARAGAESVDDDEARRAAEAIVDSWRRAGLDGFVTRVRPTRPAPIPEEP